MNTLLRAENIALPTVGVTSNNNRQCLVQEVGDAVKLQQEKSGCHRINGASKNMKTKLTGANTRLERNVQKWVNGRAEDYDNGAEGVLKDLFYGGCESGMVGHLIYYTDTVKFFQTHRRDISELLKEAVDNSGQQPAELFGDKWDKEDPLAQEDSNRNLLAWFGFEEAARNLANRNGIEI